MATADSDQSAPDDGTADVPLPQGPALTLVKSAAPLTYDSVGDARSPTPTP